MNDRLSEMKARYTNYRGPWLNVNPADLVWCVAEIERLEARVFKQDAALGIALKLLIDSIEPPEGYDAWVMVNEGLRAIKELIAREEATP